VARQPGKQWKARVVSREPELIGIRERQGHQVGTSFPFLAPDRGLTLVMTADEHLRAVADRPVQRPEEVVGMAAIPAGLTSAEASARLAADGPNELPAARPRGLLRQVWDVLRQPMLLLLLGAGTVNFLLAEPLDGAVLMLFVLVVIGISLVQEHKTENSLAALRELSTPRGTVIRDGRPQSIAGRDVVRGDVLLLSEGDRVPADAVLVEAVNVCVDESALTGESVPVIKTPLRDGVSEDDMGAPGGDGTPWIFSGTLLVKGHGTAVARATGSATELGHIGVALRSNETERTPLQREVDRLVVVLAVAGVATALLVVVVYGLTRGNWLEGLLAGIATAMAMLPEEFPVILTVFLSLGAWRLSRTRVLTRRSAVIETLGSVTVLCVDKTGTLTKNEMTASALIVDGELHDVGAGPLPDQYRSLVESVVLACPVAPFDPMDRALALLGAQFLAGTEHLHPQWLLVREYPLSGSLFALSHVWRDPATHTLTVAAKGAPEAVADLCHLDAHQRVALMGDVQAAAERGLRVLAVAQARFPADQQLPDRQQDFPFEFLGLVGLHDPVRPGVAEAVAECSRAGIRTVMITGDYPGTALAIARDIGLDHAAGCITGPQLDEMGDAELARRVGEVCVFARMVPEQKLRLIRALQANGDVVGMTGDGVNDAPALSSADIGIAMGARGTDVARESAALVITDDDFTSIVGGVRQGRGIFANLRKAMGYAIAVHIPILGMALIPVFLADWPLALLPLQIAFLQLIIDPACSVVFEAEAVDPRTMDVPPRGRSEPLVDRSLLVISVLQGLSALAVVLAVYVWAVSSGRTDDVVRSVTFVTLVLGNLALILVNRSRRLSAVGALRQRRNPTVVWILGGAMALLVVLLSVPVLREAFHLGGLGLVDWAVALLAAVAGVLWFEVWKQRRALPWWRGQRGRRASPGRRGRPTA
jgi:Ca2+-transporting ATPase